eukprot:CAMPEP_0174280180 /NCGR_PEP_ID=MMETSP0809-20121228/431_1 /TAXON_ID=73025 ORGANISM="Eutreptiella gymnastica-like, Strain CCMP1594" /NCGR_SAMPLE_ID=MMETSP0809 /ASSEMBLY_ACC=CAM_ASM_000658 /LENGTH=44 /DNA_ID= /DNA_START= /DNA_END= /DNA_ORIENTATION=
MHIAHQVAVKADTMHQTIVGMGMGMGMAEEPLSRPLESQKMNAS